MRAYLLDTTCFYSVSQSRKKQEKLQSIGPNVTTSPLAVLEIANISAKRGDFERRKRAMEALCFINPRIHQTTPDDIVAKAFGQPEPQIEPIDYLGIMRTIILANSYKEAVNEVKDPEYDVVRKIKPGLLCEWKQSLSDHFTHAVVHGNKQTREMFVTLLAKHYRELDERQLKFLSKQLTRVGSRQEMAYSFTLAGLSVRAGLHSESELVDALRSSTIDNLVESAKSKYDGSLDSYIKMYLAFQEHVSNGRTPERNTLFDLEFFLHLDAHDVKYDFVTTERLWLELGKSAISGRVIALESIV